MTNSQNTSYSQSLANFQPEHIQEFKNSAITDDTIAPNFWSFDGSDENERDQVFSLLKPEPEHNNNGTLSGTSQQELANILRGGGWVFEGHSGVSVKLDSPRSDRDGKTIKYESVRGNGNQQLFMPHVSFGASKRIQAQLFASLGLEVKLFNSTAAKIAKNEDINPMFLELFECQKQCTLIITEGAKKACSLISNGYAAIALNGVDGFGSNVYLKNENGEILMEKNPYEDGDRKVCKQDADGNNIKTLLPDLQKLVDGREIVLAFDVDDNPSTKRKVDAAKCRFRLAVEGIAKSVKQVKWKGHKGVDDLIAAEGVKAFDKAYKIRTEVKLPKPPKRPKPSSFGFSSSIEGGLVAVELDKDGKQTFDEDGQAKSERIGNHLVAIATLNNPDKNGSAFLLEFKTFKGSICKWTMPRGRIAGDGNLLIQELYEREYSFIRDKKAMLLDYLSTLGGSIEQEYIITDSSGWVDKSFVLPHKTHGDENLRFRDVEPSPDVITEVKGTLEGWKDNVAARCAGNSRLILGIGCSFAAPLLPIADVESGGFHLVGTTSQGKTTILLVAASVTGLKTVSSWRTTDNALEGGLEASNHLCLPLDELNQADPRKVGSIVYMLGNGIGKGRSTKNLTNRKSKKWLTLVLSSGETTIGKYMDSAGEAIKGGQEVRLPDVPAVPEGSQYGCFETIHGADTAVQFVSALESAVKENHGTALDAFLSRLVVDIADPTFASTLSKQVHLIAAKLCEGTKDSAIGRVAKRFALVQVSLGLAHKYDLLPFPVEQIDWAISECFNDWVKERGGDGSIEIKNAVKGIKLLLTLEKHGNRVMDVKTHNVKGNQKIEKSMGKLLAYRKIDGDGNAEEFWIEPPIFDSELCKGVNKNELTKELHRMGWLIPRSDGKMINQRSADSERNYYYVLSGKHVLGGE